MTKESLRQIIREMVQEEVRAALPEVMAEIFTSKGQKVAETTVNAVKKPIVKEQPVKKEFKKYTQNELLNKALNETVGGLPREGDIVASGLSSPSSVMDHLDQAPAPVAQALTKNYSALMKAIDKKKSGGTTGSGSVSMM
jgi:AAA+ ATPase superfamily predicted ATPase